MKTLLATLNAKYIHTSLALRWLYVANKDLCDLSFKEYTLRESIPNLVRDVVSSGCDILGLGVYIWNVNTIEKWVVELKKEKPELIIILGGPEVSYEPQFFIDKWPVDYVVSGEAEFALGELIHKIEQGDLIEMEGISYKGNYSSTVLQADIEKLASLPSPYQLEEDKDQLQHRILYFETSRGCPFQCQYCLSSLEKGIRYFPMNYLTGNLTYLIQTDTKQIKFLDRTFNLNKERTLELFQFLQSHFRPDLSLQFEIYADLLDEHIIHYINKYIPPLYFRFEIGIQSTYKPANEAVNRIQDFSIISKNIQLLTTGGKIDFHLDLIAGLPYESFEQFKASFNDVFALKAKEVQLGFLKLLRGTKLRKEALQYGYEYSEKAPYEVFCNASISKEEMERLHIAEHALDKFWNSGFFNHTLNTLFAYHYHDKYIEFFDELGQYNKNTGFPQMGYQLETLFNQLHAFLTTKKINLINEMRTDYYTHFKTRPAPFWIGSLDKKELKFWTYAIANDKPFLSRYNLNRRLIEKNTRIDPQTDDLLLLTVYYPQEDHHEIKTILYVKNKSSN